MYLMYMKTRPGHLSPIKIALFVAFGLIALVVAYQALIAGTEMRSKAGRDCIPTVQKYNCRPIIRNGKNKGTQCDHRVICVPKPTPKPKVKTLQEAKH